MCVNLKTNSLSLHPQRFLRLDEMLKMLRPIRLDAFCDVLTVEPRRLKALRLVYDFFPAEIPNVLHYSNWWDVTSYFLRQVNATWFEIDWSSIDGIFQWSHEEQWSLLYDLQDPLNDESEIEGAMDSSKWLAKTLDVVPVNCLGFWDDFGGGGSDIDEYPPLELLRYLLLPASPYPTKIWDEFFAKYDIHDFEWTGEDRAVAWEWLQGAGWSALYPAEPLCWLPELACYACARTGNFILDRASHFLLWELEDWYRWDNLDQVIADWEAAQVILHKAKTLTEWAESKHELQLLFNLITKQ